jgi:hypothetical protein
MNKRHVVAGFNIDHPLQRPRESLMATGREVNTIPPRLIGDLAAMAQIGRWR